MMSNLKVMAPFLSLLEVHSFVNTGDGKKVGLVVTQSSNKHACLSLYIQEVEFAHSSCLLLSEWVCAHNLSVVWFPSSCRQTQDWFVVRMDTSLTPTSQNQPRKSRYFLRPVPWHNADSSQWPQWLRYILPFHSCSIKTDGCADWLWLCDAHLIGVNGILLEAGFGQGTITKTHFILCYYPKFYNLWWNLYSWIFQSVQMHHI